MSSASLITRHSDVCEACVPLFKLQSIARRMPCLPLGPALLASFLVLYLRTALTNTLGKQV